MIPALAMSTRLANTPRVDGGRHVSTTVLAVLALTAALGGCSREDGASAPRQPNLSTAAPVAAIAPPSAPVADPARPAAATGSDTRQAWMQAIFAQAYDAQKKQALAQIEVDGVSEYMLMTLASATELPDGRVAVVVNGMQADENGVDITGHASPGILNVYILLRDGDAWKVGERREALSSLGSMGQFGGVTWITLGPGKPGFIVSSGGMWQGYAISHADIFELGNGMRHLGGLEEASGNSGACVPGLESGCWEIEGKISIAASGSPDGYADLQVDFSGKRYSVSEDPGGKEVEHLTETIRQRAIYRFDGKAYVLASGANPVPDI